jgi:RNA polymerase sigma-70 factor (ECF subfamily)
MADLGGGVLLIGVGSSDGVSKVYQRTIEMSFPTNQTAARRSTGPRRTALPLSRTRGIHSSAPQLVLYSVPLRSPELALQFYSFDAEYVQRLCAGDRQTQEHFVGYFTELLQIKLRSRLQSPHAIEDVRQETFSRVFAVLGRDGGLRQPERLGPFVNTVCNHVLMEHYRSSGRSDSLDAEGCPELPAAGADALELASAHQIKDKIRQILLDLPPRDRSLLNAVFLDERDRDEVCREFGVDRDYLRVLLHRAKQEFKTEYLRRIKSPSSLGANP